MIGRGYRADGHYSPVVIGPSQKSRSRFIERRKTRVIAAQTSGGDGSSGGGGSTPKRTGWDGERYDRSGNPLGLLTLAIAGSLTAYQVKDILEEPFWLEDTQLKSVSIIVPALNERAQIEDSIRSLQSLDPPACEIIVVDGGSTDGTEKLAKRAGATVITAPRGRARQMNAGAEVAEGDILCFLHADSRVPENTVAKIRKHLQDKRVVLGGFRTVIKDGDRPLIFMTAHQFIKTFYIAFLFRPLSFFRGARLLFGDQTLFCRACDFRRVGGYAPRLPIMEDADLCIRLHMAGPEAPVRSREAAEAATGAETHEKHHFLPAWFHRRGKVIMILQPAAETSGRRLQAWGNPKATFVHFLIGLRWYLGATPEQLKALYMRMYTDDYR
ncbi:g6445 [Coccomyxa viridis]|uniref:G6445 protein n=1 Tax=Coccomyxa viridis TaxID=1274662 RepID=A0ABP1G0A5_9CHLO